MTTEQNIAIEQANAKARYTKRSVFQVELYVDAIDEKAVWVFLKQLTTIDNYAGLSEEPSIYSVDEMGD